MQFADCCMPIVKLIAIGVDLIPIATRLSFPFAPLAARLSSKPDYNVNVYNTGDVCYVLGSTLLYSTLLYSTLLYSTLLYCTILYYTILCCAMLV